MQTGLVSQMQSTRCVGNAKQSQRLIAMQAASGSKRKLSPLEKGGTLKGEKALGKDAGAATLGGTEGTMGIQDGRFVDPRWVDGTWDFSKFQNEDGKVNWDDVIDAEMGRRKLLEDTPIASMNEDKVNFLTEMVPWWAWVKRFHLPEAELINGRAAMVGYFFAMVIDAFGSTGVWDLQSSFAGKLALHVVVISVLLVRNLDDIKKYAGLLDEATFYDSQWNAAWEGVERPTETEDV